MCVWCGVRVHIYMKKCTPSCLVNKSIVLLLFWIFQVFWPFLNILIIKN
jgi:hypothetical protein